MSAFKSPAGSPSLLKWRLTISNHEAGFLLPNPPQRLSSKITYLFHSSFHVDFLIWSYRQLIIPMKKETSGAMWIQPLDPCNTICRHLQTNVLPKARWSQNSGFCNRPDATEEFNCQVYLHAEKGTHRGKYKWLGRRSLNHNPTGIVREFENKIKPLKFFLNSEYRSIYFQSSLMKLLKLRLDIFHKWENQGLLR